MTARRAAIATVDTDTANSFELGAEAVLVSRAKSGDKSAFRTLYQQNVDVVFWYLRRRLSYHEAEDATAEVFCSAWRKLADFEYRGIPFRGWLLAIARNLVRNAARRHSVFTFTSVEPRGIESGSEPGADIQALANTGREAVVASLQLVDERFRSILTMRFLEELTVKETADRSQCSEENVRVRTFRGLQQLRSIARSEFD